MKRTGPSGFSLWELLLTCAVAIVAAPLVLPLFFVDSHAASDETASRIILGAIQQTRSAGLAGRVVGGRISFTSATSTFTMQSDQQALPSGYVIKSISLDGTQISAIEAGFDPLGNISFTPYGNQAVLTLARADGTEIRTITLEGKGIPIPQPTAGTAETGGSSGGGGGRGCRWL
ncbi:MAG TPA: type II secretion system protein [Candidatus Ozemobacteraceae bacterium]|nr:type II secretion system protein [Candidatus Ozemobacteraceae bacterium]HOT28176.1 type II secretion system protein [Candidatus Ozemobacteraceae bacterium]